MQKLIIFLFTIFILSSCSSKEKQDIDTHVVEDSVENTSVYAPTTAPNYTTPTYESSNQTTNQQTNSTSSEVDDNNGYQFGYDIGYIAGQNNDVYNPYLPNTSSFPMAYRQAYCQGYDAGYQKGQESAGRPSYYVNTGDGDYEDYEEDAGEVYYYEDDDY